jgi:hypothetical protein
MTEIYVREVVRAGSLRDGAFSNRVVLFVHGAGTPAEVSFDLQYRDYSWIPAAALRRRLDLEPIGRRVEDS